VSIFPPRQRPDESDLEWALRLYEWSSRQQRSIESYRWLIFWVMLPVLAVLALWVVLR